MTMEAQPSQDGRTKISLGPVERWIALVIAGAIVSIGYWLVGSMQSVLTQQQVTNQQITGLQQQLQIMNTQLADASAEAGVGQAGRAGRAEQGRHPRAEAAQGLK